MGLDVAACLLDLEFGQRRVVGTGARHQHVVDGRGQPVEERAQLIEIGGVEGRDTGPELLADPLQSVQIAAR